MKTEKIKYVELIASMSHDYLLGKITWELYKSNLEMIVKKFNKLNQEK